MENTFDGIVEYSCLGDWFVGKNHFFAVANTKESRKDEKYRCFMKNREDDYFLGVSDTPECNRIKTVEKVIFFFNSRFFILPKKKKFCHLVLLYILA